MRRRRARAMTGRPIRSGRALADHELCRGPGNLTMAMGITLAENRCDLLGDRLFIEDGGGPARRLIWGPRIGIAVGTDRPWRVYAAGSLAVSGDSTAEAAGLQRCRIAASERLEPCCNLPHAAIQRP